MESLSSSSKNSWISYSLSCTTKEDGWVWFILLFPCPQRLMLLALNLLFLILLSIVSLSKLVILVVSSRLHSEEHDDENSDIINPILPTSPPKPATDLWFKWSALVATLASASCSAISCILSFTTTVEMNRSWDSVSRVCWLVQSITQLAIAVLMIRFKAHRLLPLPLRIHCFLYSVVVALFSSSAIVRLADEESRTLLADDVISIFVFVLSLPPLLTISFRVGVDHTSNCTYGSASVISKALWLWMNPLLSKGYKSPLQINDVPILEPRDRASTISALFDASWSFDDDTRRSRRSSSSPLFTTMLRMFWKEVAYTALLAIVHLFATFTSPVLVRDFVDYTNNDRRTSSPYQGFCLVLALFAAKFIEALTTHHFNFNTQKLGMRARSALVTSVYRKGLRLSCSARQAHGVGQIVNYMAVDAQQLSDMTLHFHAIWLMPFQVGGALFLLYGVMGASSSLTALLGVVALLCFALFTTKRNNKFQFNLMVKRDSRMKAINELMNCMRVIKFQAWEEHFRNKIQGLRDSEFEWLSKFMYSISQNMIVLSCAPMLISTFVFAIAALFGVLLDVGTVFTTTTIIRILHDPIVTFPQSIISISQAVISLGRLDEFMLSKELVEGSVERGEVGGDGGKIVLEIQNGVFTWDDEAEEPILQDINLNIQNGELAAIVGTVGSGKSSLLGSILGEMHKVSGNVRVGGSTAYVSQNPWIQNGTIKENILFGLPMDSCRYSEAVKVCCLEKDIEMMEFGDQTEIGERGINLSGGQKQRIQLARAVYQDCDIYLLDDVFSAIDAHTATDIFKECLRGVLKGKTILLVTHQVDFLQNFDLITVMRGGKIVQSGKYNELLELGTDFETLVAAHETAMELVEGADGSNNEIGSHAHAGQKTRKSLCVPFGPEGKANGGDKVSLELAKSNHSTPKLIEDEAREMGKVGADVYKQYFTQAFGWSGVVVAVALALLSQGALMVGDYWLAYETSSDRAAIFDSTVFISVYAMIGATSIVLLAFKSVFVTCMGLNTAQIFFRAIFDSIMRAPISFFDTTPSGRILTRASTDQSNIDFILPLLSGVALDLFVAVLSIVIVICQNVWPTVFLLIPLGCMNIWYMGYFLATSRELTRLESITKAPIIHHFSESIAGVVTIRSLKNAGRFCQENVIKVDSNMRMDFYNNGSSEWLGLRLELIGNVILCCSAIFLVVLPSKIVNPANVGLSLSYGLSLSSVLSSAVNMICTVENHMVSVERIKQFTNIEPEAARTKKNEDPPQNWPAHGRVELWELKVRYHPNTPLVLKGITLCINGGEKVGVVGRTGSGKSTLLQVLFRLVEPSSGKIIIDGLDISTLGLHDLRSRFGIIPQEPVLFEGSVRSNVDPLGLYSDSDIWKSLERCQLKDVVAAKPQKLDDAVKDNGENWSVGQKQLLCLGRVLLKKSRLLFMDEATASVDSKTDSVIQRVIREDFESCTVVNIAHRLPTVMDCDRVLVVDDGVARDFDKPADLLERPSLFAALVQEYANRSAGL